MQAFVWEWGGLLIAEVVAEVIVTHDLLRGDFDPASIDPNADVPGYLYDWRSAELARQPGDRRHRHAGRS